MKKFILMMSSFLLLFGSVIFIYPTRAMACSCAALPNIQEQLQRKTAVFSGKVESIKEPSRNRMFSSADAVKVVLSVNEIWKGELGTEATVYTAVSSESCGYEGFRVGETYIVYASGEINHLETGRCEGTKQLASAEKDMKELGDGVSPTRLKSHSPPELKSSEKSTFGTVTPLIIVIVVAIFILAFFLRKRRSRF
ncbi:hypothetical protein M3194_20675 [Paenibacillus glycanilyticus]|uniref:hypothetical protein n=1 Tax=Paenibacillus glycanilyticus TaxID=126569 RepID=UPI00203D4323|nr:hypothetical protein [Paenibacillus glycanilyticus]MCM3629759.1 hypothetical protein [Paenibacillus glycanilyticus]